MPRARQTALDSHTHASSSSSPSPSRSHLPGERGQTKERVVTYSMLEPRRVRRTPNRPNTQHVTATNYSDPRVPLTAPRQPSRDAKQHHGGSEHHTNTPQGAATSTAAREQGRSHQLCMPPSHGPTLPGTHHEPTTNQRLAASDESAEVSRSQQARPAASAPWTTPLDGILQT